MVDNNRAIYLKPTSPLSSKETLELAFQTTGKGSSQAVRAVIGCYKVIPGTNIRASLNLTVVMPIGIETPVDETTYKAMALSLMEAFTEGGVSTSEDFTDNLAVAMVNIGKGAITLPDVAP